MSLDKAIKSGKEHRKPYTCSKSFDHTCRNHGSCDWCKENRLIKSIRAKKKSAAKLKDYQEELSDEEIQVSKNSTSSIQ